MSQVQDFQWKKGITVSQLVEQLGDVGFQSVELAQAADVIVKMKKDSAKIFLTFTSNMVTSGLRGFFAQLIKLGMANVIVTTVGGIEEDIMKATGEKFSIGSFSVDDVELHEKGVNRVGNLFINNESYMNFEDWITPVLQKLYEKQPRWAVSEMLREIG
ncbi:MAG: deoxyhypusine synthase family protein, partial [Nanoarchaeota archaeon]